MNLNENEKYIELREILLKYSHGSKKDNEQLLRDIVINKTIKLNDYKDIVEDLNNTYKMLYQRLNYEAREYLNEHEEEVFTQYEEEQAAKKILADVSYSLKGPYSPESYDVFYYSLQEINELKEKLDLYLNNNNVSKNTKKSLKDINKDIINTLNNYEKNKEKPKEKEFKKIIELYNSGEKDTVYKEMIQNESEYQIVYKLRDRDQISIITRNEIYDILKECQKIKAKIQKEFALDAICYFYDIDSDIKGEFKKEYLDVYKAYLSNPFTNNLDGISEDKKEKIEKIISNIEQYNRELSKLYLRGYDEEKLTCLNKLLEKYKRDERIRYATVNKLEIGKNRIETWDVSTYLIKFKNDHRLSDEEYEIYKKFAKEHGYKILSWIILENTIDDSQDENSISLEEVINFCRKRHTQVPCPVNTEISKVKNNLKNDKSLTDAEKEEIVRKIQLFIKKYEQAVANKTLESNGFNKDSYNKIVNEILDPNYIARFDEDKNNKYIEMFTSIYEVTRSESVKEVLMKLKETEKTIQKDINVRKRTEIYVAIIKNFQKIANLIIEGVSYGNGKRRPFDMIDYYQITSLTPDEIENIGKEALSAKQWTAWKSFKPKTEDNEFIGEKRLKAIMESKVEYGAKIENKKVIPGTGKILSDEEKTAILNYLKSKKVPFTVRNYLVAQKRYTTGIIEQELLDSQNNNSDDKKVNKKNS